MAATRMATLRSGTISMRVYRPIYPPSLRPAMAATRMATLRPGGGSNFVNRSDDIFTLTQTEAGVAEMGRRQAFRSRYRPIS